MAKLPKPEDYGISPRVGFLSPHRPLTVFKDPYYEPWDVIIADLSTLISSNRLEDEVKKLPLLTTDKLTDEPDYRRAYVVLAFLVHAYVWSPEEPNENVPPQITEPFLQVCEYLRMETVLSYAGLCSWNWQIRNGGGMDLEHMETIASFTGTQGEAAFYHVPVLVEFEGGHLVHLLLDAVRAAADDSRGVVVKALNETTKSIIRMGEQLPKMYSVLDANFFYHVLRPFLAGGKGMEEKGLPRGMVFTKSDGSETERKLVGGSAAMSSLFPFLDYALGVIHSNDSVFQEMRAYMPSAHRDFLNEVSQMPSLREYVERNVLDTELLASYEDCLESLRAWRGKHIVIVSKYIVQPAREAERASRVEQIEVTGPSETDKEWELQGTGGSALVPFLRQARDDTVGVSQRMLI